jgi:translocation and assembly module TamA
LTKRWCLLGLAAAFGSAWAQDAAPVAPPSLPPGALPAATQPGAQAEPAMAPDGSEPLLEERRISWVLNVEAPADLKPLLERYLDLARFQRTVETERITRAELLRLLAAAPDQVRSLLETEGYFDARATTILGATQQPASTPAGIIGSLDPLALTQRLVSEVDGLLRRLPGVADSASPADLIVTLQVDPGPLTLVKQARVEFEGPLSVAADAGDPASTALVQQIRAQWSLGPGKPYTQDAWSAAKSQVLALLRAEGYVTANWSGSVAQVQPEAQAATLFLVVDSGPLYRFGEVEFEGLQHVDTEALRALLNFAAGEPLREKTLLDYQDRLVKTGLFDAVSVTIEPDASHAEAMPVHVRVKERDRLQTTFGLGVSDTSGPRATVEHLDQSLWGWAWQAKSKLQVGRITRSASVDLTSHPKEDAHRNLLSGALSYSEATGLAVKTQRARIGRTQDSERFERLYYLEWQRAATNELGGASVDDASAVTANYQWVWRNLDNPIMPTRGFGFSASVAGGRSFATIDSSGWFSRATGRLTAYWTVGQNWYGQARIEGGEVFSRDSVSVPYTLLFRAGGDDSVRGYGYQDLGPVNASGVSVGGKVMATGSVEIARPFSLSNPALLGAVFFDAGNAAGSWQEFSVAQGYGVGVRWRSPVGPLRIDLAYGEQVKHMRLHFSVGLTF